MSTRPLPVKEYWNVDVTGILSTFSGVSRDGTEIRQRVLIVSPENVTVYCSRNGKPVPFIPIKGLDMDWPCKRSLAELASEGVAENASVSVMSEGSLPSMPDSLDSEPDPVYCATIAEAKAQAEGTAVELQCKPINSATSGSLVMGEDDAYDTLTVYCTNTVVADDRVNKVTGTIHVSGSDKVLDVDSGPGFDPDGYIGSVQTVPEGTIAWAKTFADGLYLPIALSEKVVSRTFPALGYFYVQEPSRACGIRIIDSASAESLHIGDIVTISDGEMTTVDGERAINYAYTEMDSSGDAPRLLGMNNKALGGGGFNVLTEGPVDGVGTNNVGLLIRAWGKVTATGSGYFYIDDGSNLSDGSGSTGVRVEGVITYMPDVDDYVAVTGISGLKTVSDNLARVVRVASSSDFTPITPATPDGLEAYATGASTIRLYWPATPGATGYNIYRGLTTGGEDYDNPLNGSTPVTALTYQDTGLTEDVEYFYTIKAVSSSGISQPSDENSAVPYAGAVPWGGSVYDVTSAIQARVSGYADYIRVCGPDGTICDSTQSTPQPPDGSVTEGTNLFVHSSGQVFPLPGDGAVVSSSGEEGGYGMLSAGWTPVELNGHSYGPYRRVSSRQESGHYYFGAGGNFVLPDRNGVSLKGSVWYERWAYAK